MSLGWKVGFGSPAAMEKLGIDRPLVAPITHATLLEDGATVDISAWTNPKIELEIAVHAGIGIGVALELVDLHTPPDDSREILAGGIYHRHTVLGPVAPDPAANIKGTVPFSESLPRDDAVQRGLSPFHGTAAGGAGHIKGTVPFSGRLICDGEVVAETDDVAALTGGHEAMVRVVEETIGRKLHEGEVVITGSIVPPTSIAAGQRWQGEVHPLDALAVNLAPG
jgi:hypothetical protein